MKTNLLLTFFLFSIICAAQESNSNTYHRAKIYYQTESDFNKLEQIGIPLDHGNHKKGVYFESDFSQSEINQAKNIGYNVEITINDVKSFYINQNNPNHKDYVGITQTRNASCPDTGGSTEYQTPVNFEVKPANQFGGFYTYSEALQELDDMAALYPNLITTKSPISNFLTEGQTNNSTTPSIGNNPIYWVKISDNPSSTTEGEPEILYSAIHHAREPASLQQLIFYMWYLLENYDTDPEIKAIVDNTELYFVPVINPDGYLHNEFTNPQGGGFWRKNRNNGNGVDNNRNYDYHINGNANNSSWGGPGSSSNPGSDLYHGTGPFSEVENQAMKWFVEQHNFVLALNNHTFGELIYYPFGYANVATPDDALYQQITGLMTSVNGYNALRDSPFAGDSDDFMYGTVGTHNKIFAMTPEIGTSFWPAQSAIESICKDMMFTNITAAQLAGNSASITDNSTTFISSIVTPIDYTIKRTGIEAGDFTVSINPISTNITSTGSSVNHNGLALLQEQTGSINLNLNSNITDGDTIVFELIVNNGAYNKVTTITKTFGATITILDEPGNDTATNWDATDWGISTTEFVSPSSSITDSPNGNYNNNENKTITLSSALNLTTASNAILSFNAKWDIENNFDYVQVQVSNNAGTTWIPQCGKFTNTGVANQTGANNEPVYDGVQSNWVLEEIDLSDYLGDSILIRFQLVTDGGLTEDGFYFDDLTVKVVDANLSTSDFIERNFNIFPNPVTNSLNINSNLSNYDYKIYNVQGQLLSEVSKNSNFTSINYSNYSSGIYLLDIIHNNNKKTYKIIKK